MADRIKKIQRALNEWGYKLAVDGITGPRTEKAIVAFQKSQGFYATGIVGATVWEALHRDPSEWKDAKKRLRFKKIVCDQYTRDGESKGADQTWLREDAAKGFEQVVQKVHELGGKITSSGGRRALGASAGANRSQTSLHYLGLAHDLHIWSGMVDPENDPYVVVRMSAEDYQGERREWFVYARTDDETVPEQTLRAYTYDHKEVEVTGRFISLTMLMVENGFQPIRARKSFFTRKSKLAAEWWHFQYEDGLEEGAKFGHELLKSFKLAKLRSYSVWNHRDVMWKATWF